MSARITETARKRERPSEPVVQMWAGDVLIDEMPVRLIQLEKWREDAERTSRRLVTVEAAR